MIKAVVLCVYAGMFLFFLGVFLYVADRSEDGKLRIGDIAEVVFFAALWPVTILTYINIKLFDRRNRK